MKTIWKYHIPISGLIPVEMPKGAKFLTVQVQNEAACVWALVSPSADNETRYLEVHGTGTPIHGDMGIERKYIGTFQQPPFVWHLFERIN